ncbi:MAG TPA: hypothetical protein VGH45_10560 [Solirubrobacteraceae bacterium]
MSIFAAATAFVVVTNMRPGYDAFGWLVWGHQVLHWNLNTDGAPSWKPLTFLFTLPFALAGRGDIWLWMVVSVAGAFAGVVFAGRIAYRLSGPCPERRYAPWVAAAFAGIGVIALDGYWQQILIANSDPLVVTLCLAAIDAHFSRRPRLAFAALVLASLGRPEVWVFLGLYALWAWRAVPSMRLFTAVGALIIPALWFVIPGLTAKSWFEPGELALRSVNPINVIHGSRFSGIIDRFFSLYALPVWLAALSGLGIAAARRDRQTLGLAAAVCLWVAVEIGLALHGWSGATRYLFEPAAVAVVIAGSAVGRLLGFAPRGSTVLGWLGPVAVVTLLVALYPLVRDRVHAAQPEFTQAHSSGRQLDRLQAVIASGGGAGRIRRCGKPTTLVGNQSMLAWALGMNVGEVGYKIGRGIDSGRAIVVYKPHDHGWRVHPFNIAPADRGPCNRLKTNSAFG